MIEAVEAEKFGHVLGVITGIIGRHVLREEPRGSSIDERGLTLIPANRAGFDGGNKPKLLSDTTSDLAIYKSSVGFTKPVSVFALTEACIVDIRRVRHHRTSVEPLANIIFTISIKVKCCLICNIPSRIVNLRRELFFAGSGSGLGIEKSGGTGERRIILCAEVTGQCDRVTRL